MIDNGIYNYKPSIICAAIAIAGFGISGLVHLFVTWRTRTWFYSAMTVGAIMMAGGYGARIASANSPDSIMQYALQTVLIMVPPSLYAATIYMIYGRLVVFVKASYASVIRPQWVTKIFVVGDVIAFLLQLTGGALTAQEDTQSLGEKITIVGLVFQLIFFGFFLIISVIFWKRLREPSTISYPMKSGWEPWQPLFKLMLVAAVVIILRCIFRIIELSQGYNGYLMSHEAYMYIFDTVPMLLVQVMFHFKHASKIFGSSPQDETIQDNESYVKLTDRC